MKNLSCLPSLATLTISLISIQSATAATLTLNFTKLSGLTGGSPAETAVFRAEIPALDFDITSIVIKDNGQGNGGSPGQVSGFDLDAIKLSSIFTNNAAEVNSIEALDVFDFSSNGTFLTLGTQRSPEDTQLFGNTDGVINNSIASLGSLDANSIIDPTMFGFVALGDNGLVEFKLKNPVSTGTPLYLYFGEVGNNGEVANVEVIGTQLPSRVPEPSSMAALSLAGIFLAVTRNKKTKAERF